MSASPAHWSRRSTAPSAPNSSFRTPSSPSYRAIIPASKPLSVAALATESFVVCEREATPALFDSILALCSSAGFSPRIVNASATWAGVLTLVESGEGVALVPSGVRYLRTPGVAFSPLVPRTTHVGLSIAWNPNNESPIQEGFLRLVRESKDRIQRSNGT
jgi:DNA-binding transcriptional LysR family regulator